MQEKEVKILSDGKIRELIWNDIKILTEGETVTFTMPWHLGLSPEEKSEPIKITVTHVKLPKKSDGPLRQKYKGSVVDTQCYDSYELSDGGRAFAELEKKVGDVTPYLKRIERILYKTGMNELRGGRIITKTYDLYSSWITTHHLDGFLTAITIIANLDILPPYTSSKWSSERNNGEDEE